MEALIPALASVNNVPPKFLNRSPKRTLFSSTPRVDINSLVPCQILEMRERPRTSLVIFSVEVGPLLPVPLAVPPPEEETLLSSLPPCLDECQLFNKAAYNGICNNVSCSSTKLFGFTLCKFRTVRNNCCLSAGILLGEVGEDDGD